MDRVRPSLVLLAALAALLGAPAAAHAAAPTNTTPAAPSGWEQSYTVVVSGDDVDGGPLTAEWHVNGIAFAGPAPANVVISDTGANTFETRIVDQDAYDSGWRVETVRIDPNLPVDSTDPGTTAWRPTVTSVTLTAYDATSSIDHMEWELDGGPTQGGPAGTVVAVNDDGAHTLRTRAVDAAGNTSLWRTHTIRIDTVDPADTTAALGGWHTAPYGLTVAGADTHSGIRDVTWRYQGGGPKLRKGEKAAPVDGRKRYQEIVSGSREGLYLNTSGNARDGKTFVRVIDDGVEYHIYGSGDDRVTIANDLRDDERPGLQLPRASGSGASRAARTTSRSSRAPARACS